MSDRGFGISDEIDSVRWVDGVIRERKSQPNNSSSSSFTSAVWRVMDEAGNLLISKHHDYGPKNISGAPGGPHNGLRVRLYDKLARLNNLFDEGSEPQHEPIEDSYKDVANYGVIGLLVQRGLWPK